MNIAYILGLYKCKYIIVEVCVCVWDLFIGPFVPEDVAYIYLIKKTRTLLSLTAYSVTAVLLYTQCI